MDADEEAARREAIEQGERQRRDRDQARQPNAVERPTPPVVAQPPEATARRPVVLVEAVPDESAADVARRFAAAVEAARDQARREAAEEAAREVERKIAAAVEEARIQARREAADEMARQLAAAAVQARQAAEEEMALRVAAAAEGARDEARREAAEDAARQVAVAEVRARREAAEVPAPVEELAPELEPREPVGEATPHADSVEPVVRKAVEEPESGAATGDKAREDSDDVLPLHKWLQSATQSEESAAGDWPRALLESRRKSKLD